MTTETMIERLVQAMFDAIEATALDSDGLALQGGRIYFNGDFDAQAVARAALQALREPTEEMVSAGIGDVHLAPLLRDGTNEVWRSMIDAALQEQSK